MTVSQPEKVIFRYEGNGVTDTFAYNARVFSASNLVVVIVVRANDEIVETLALTEDYSVTLLANGNASVTVEPAHIPSSSQDIVIYREIDISQNESLPSGTVFPAKKVENGLDKLTVVVQDLADDVSRSAKLPAVASASQVTLPVPLNNHALAWSGTSGELVNVPISPNINTGDLYLASAGASGAGNLSYSFSADTDTGFYRSAANTVTWQMGGTNTFVMTTGIVNAPIAMGVGFDGVPGNSFEVRNSSDTQIRVRNGASSAQSYDFGRNGTTGFLTFYGNQTSFTGYVFTGIDGERMRIGATGNVGINGTANANAILDVQSTTKAFMPPRMTTAQRSAIASPTAGMVIYNSTTNRINVYNGTVWTEPSFVRDYTIPDQVIASATTRTIAHGFGVVPKNWKILMRCTTAEHGYSIGDVIEAPPHMSTAAADDVGYSVRVDATNIYIRFGSAANPLRVMHNTSTGSQTATNGSWVITGSVWV